MPGISALHAAPFPVKVSILSLACMVCTPAVICIPLAILFKEPRILCTDPQTDSQFECSEIMACTYNYPFKVIKDDGPYSLSTQYELICENSSLKRLAFTCIFFGYLVAAIMQTLIVIEKKWHRPFMVCASFGLVTILALMFFVGIFDLEFILIACLLFGAGFFLIYANTYSYIYVSDTYNSDLVSFYMILTTILWASMGIFFTMLGYFFNSDWRVIIGVGSIILLVSTIIFTNSKITENIKSPLLEEEEIDEEPENMNIFSYFKDMWPNKTIRNNFLIYTLTWSLGSVCYSVIYIELESVGGSVYFTTISCCCLEICCGLLGSILMQKYKCKTVQNAAAMSIVVVFLVFFMAPVSIGEASGLLVGLLVFCLLVGKLCTDMVNLMIYLNLARMFTDKYVGLYVIISRGFARVLTVFMPTVNFFIRNLGIHPFVFYGFIYFGIWNLLKFCREVQEEGMEDLLNDAKVGIVDRLAIASCSRSLVGSTPHEDILKRIKVEGVKLSEIHKSRLKPNSIHANSGVMNLSTPLLKGINVNLQTESERDSEKKKRVTLFELRQNLRKQEMVDMTLKD